MQLRMATLQLRRDSRPRRTSEKAPCDYLRSATGSVQESRGGCSQTQHVQNAIIKFAIYLKNPETQSFYYTFKTRPTVFGRWSTNPPKTTETRERFCKTTFQLGMDLKKVEKQGRDERTQEDNPTLGVYFWRCRVVSFRFFFSSLSLVFRPIPKMK